MTFVHLHCHSDYSLMDAVAPLPRIVERAVEQGWSALALTDHGTASGWFSFWKECQGKPVKPIFGIEAYCAHSLKHVTEEGKTEKDPTYHMVLLAKDTKGYQQLCKLLYKANSETYYYKPVILFEDLFAVEAGHLVVTTACIGGLNRLIEKEGYDKALEMAQALKDKFGADFYIEIQLNELEEQHRANTYLMGLSLTLDVSMILTNDCHYVRQEDVKAQDVLHMLKFKRIISQESIVSRTRHNYYCSYEDFFRFNTEFGYNYEESFIAQCLECTLEVAEKCNYSFDTKTLKFPVTENADERLARRTQEELVKKGLDSREEYAQRLSYELQVLGTKKYASYFLIFDDLYAYAKAQGMWSGPGRGSAAGCLVSYLLGITKLDPLKYSLMFERFLDPSPESTQLPDIDTDWDSSSHELVKNYLIERWGAPQVCNVGTISKFHMKGILRDVARVYEIDLEIVNQLLKSLEQTLPPQHTTIMSYFQSQRDINIYIKRWLEDERCLTVLGIADTLHGNVRHRSKHAAGIVIFPTPVWEHIPVDSLGGDDTREIITAFSGGQEDKQLEDLKTLKLDILGLNTVTILHKTQQLVLERTGQDIAHTLLHINEKDTRLYDKFKDGENIGVFQFESPSINKLIKAVQPSCFEDIIAINALHRPGQISFAYDYAERKVEPPPHPIIGQYTQNTRGVIVYQEQLMLILAAFMGVPMGATNTYRKILGRKGIDPEHPSKWDTKLKKFAKEFVAHALETHPDMTKECAIIILRYLMKYAGYGFNYSHAACYSYISLQTLFCKVYYPLEFYCAALNSSSKEEDYEKYMRDAQQSGIHILPITFHESQYQFAIEGDKIRMGFCMLKGFGEIAYDELRAVGRTQIKTLEDLFTQKWSKFNKTSIQVLNNVYAFHDLYQQSHVIDKVLESLTPNDKTRIKKGSLQKVKEKIKFVVESTNGEGAYDEFMMRQKAQAATGLDYFGILGNNKRKSRIENVKSFVVANELPTFDTWGKGRYIVCGVMLDYSEQQTAKGKTYILATVTDGTRTEKVKVWAHSIKDLHYSFRKFVDLCYNHMVAYEMDYEEKWGFAVKRVVKIFKQPKKG